MTTLLGSGQTAGKGPGGTYRKSREVSSIKPSAHLAEVRYEIRGALTRRARELEAAGRPIIKLNIGNPGRYGFTTPAHLREAIASRLTDSEAYGHEQGLEEAREAIVAQQRARGAIGVEVERVFVGNGVSELIDLSLRALIQPGEEVLLPSPDYPLWSAATILNNGHPRYYRCLAENGHLPDPDEMESLIGPRTRAIVLINPNNPTGAVYPKALLERIVGVARKHNLLLLCDEIYDEILYDGTPFQPLAAVAGDHPCVSFGGLSKVHRACGYRVGWMSLSGDPKRTVDYREALQLLSALRLCANVTAQWAVKPALLDKPTITELTSPGGRLHEARRLILDQVKASPYFDLVAPGGAIYAFPWVRADAVPHFDDTAFALRLLDEENVLVVPGTSFNLPASRHLRLTLLPELAQLGEVFARMDRVLGRMAAEDRPLASAVA
ncbi:aminotransferase class I/II-fold pyridoxal phosphate-dependent enzyme [Luteibacter anthropi]|nr:aminotransferase class I/II-fold pyridoxal phosphate-dependent enzyme [Luteibacter anthropi]